MAAPQAPPAKSPLAQPVTALWGVGPERAAQLARLDIHTIEDLLLHKPRRYEDRRNPIPIAGLRPDHQLVHAEVRHRLDRAFPGNHGKGGGIVAAGGSGMVGF